MRKHINLSKSFALLIGGVICTSNLSGCFSDSDPSNADLSALVIDGASDLMYPTFDKAISHYALRCDTTDVLTLTATTAMSQASISINGESSAMSQSTLVIANPTADQDITVEVSSGDQTSSYTVHCLANDFPQMQVLRADPSVTTDLMLLSPRFMRNGETVSYIVVLDNNGVPRFRQRIESNVNDFKRHQNGWYSYAKSQGRNEFGLRDWIIVLLDEDFNELDQIETVGLTQTDNHDFIITDEGSYILISYNSSTRDMTAFGLSAEEIVGDSVIQEITADGQVLFQWDSWDHIDLLDCQATGFFAFPVDYAHLNSLDLTPEGDLIASFRGCGQVLKIDRPSGDVIWRFGGSMSDFLIVGDPFNEVCGQHTALEPSPDSLLMFDNGIYCLGDREDTFGSFSRVVEYRLDSTAGQAHFVRDHSLFGTYQEFTRSLGSVQLLDNGNWFIGWGNGPDISVTEVNPDGDEIFALRVVSDSNIALTYRAFREASLPDQ